MASSKSARGATNGVTNTTSIRSTNRSLMITSAQMMGPGLDASGRSGSPTPVGSARPTNPVGHWKIPVGLQCHCSNIVKLHDILSVSLLTPCPLGTRHLVRRPHVSLSVTQPTSCPWRWVLVLGLNWTLMEDVDEHVPRFAGASCRSLRSLTPNPKPWGRPPHPPVLSLYLSHFP